VINHKLHLKFLSSHIENFYAASLLEYLMKIFKKNIWMRLSCAARMHINQQWCAYEIIIIEVKEEN